MLNAWSPPEEIKVSDWAERDLVLSVRTTPHPGLLKFDRTPYLRDIVNAISSDNVEQLTIASSAQVAKTVAVMVGICYAIDQSPGPALLVLPNEDLCKSLSEQRLQPLIDDCRKMAAHRLKGRKHNKTLEMTFDRMTLALVGSNSPAQLASRPVRYLFMDELDKFPGATGKEADAVSLALERTMAYWNRKIIRTSTPTLDSGPIWRAFLDGDQRYYYVACPYCGEMQRLLFGNVKWDEKLKDKQSGRWLLRQIQETAYYECAKCKEHIGNGQRPRMVIEGEWRPSVETWGHQSHQISRLYSLLGGLTWGHIAVKFLKSKPYQEELRNFINSWLGEPWEERKDQPTENQVMEHKAGYKEGTCPGQPVAVVLTADVQKDCVWYVLRAWGAGETSWLIRYGVVPSMEALNEIAYHGYPTPNGKVHVNCKMIDSGDGSRTEEIYRFCAKHGFIASKGSDSARLHLPYKWSQVPIGEGSINLFSYQTDHFKDLLHLKLITKNDDPGAWLLHDNTDYMYASQILSEYSSTEYDKLGRPKRKWKMVASGADNHLLDCFDEKTEVLTYGGWKRWPDVTYEDEFATVNLERDEIEYQHPINLISRHYRGEMVYVNGRRLEFMVTPNHRMITYRKEAIKRQWTFDNPPKVTLAKDLDKWHRIKVTAKNWNGIDHEKIRFGPTNETRRSYENEKEVDAGDLFELLGWFVSEGHRNSIRAGSWMTVLSQNPGDKQERIKKLLSRLPWPWRMATHRQIIITSRQLHELLDDCLVSGLGRGCYRKCVPQLVKNASQRLIERFLDSAVEGDGWTQRGFRTYATTSKTLADGIQELFIKLGRASNMKTKTGVVCKIRGENSANCKPQYHVTECLTETASLRQGDNTFLVSKVDYDGMVYCATVPNGTLVVRRNGRQIIAGNCEIMGLALACAYGFRFYEPEQPKGKQKAIENTFKRPDGRDYWDRG